MKRQPAPNPRPNGFSLTELLVVITIMAILAGITIAALGPIQNRAAAKAVTATITEIESALTSYEIDFGWFPVAPEGGVTGQDPITRNQEGLEGSAILYKELSGDFDEDGELDDDTKTYLKGVINSKTKSIEAPTGGGYWLLDAFNSPIRYLADSRNVEDRQTFNPTFDLWSIADTDPSEAAEDSVRRNYITNYGFR